MTPTDIRGARAAISFRNQMYRCLCGAAVTQKEEVRDGKRYCTLTCAEHGVVASWTETVE